MRGKIETLMGYSQALFAYGKRAPVPGAVERHGRPRPCEVVHLCFQVQGFLAVPDCFDSVALQYFVEFALFDVVCLPNFFSCDVVPQVVGC